MVPGGFGAWWFWCLRAFGLEASLFWGLGHEGRRYHPHAPLTLSSQALAHPSIFPPPSFAPLSDQVLDMKAGDLFIILMLLSPAPPLPSPPSPSPSCPPQ